MRVESYLTNISHSYIANGSAVNEIAMAAVCSGINSSAKPCGVCKDCKKVSAGIHPDVIYLSIPEDKRGIVVEQIRAIKSDVYIAPNEAVRKVYVVNDSDTMNLNAQNAFLQLLEEPPAHAVFILKTSNPAALLPTVRSRCVTAMSNMSSDGGASGEDFAEISQMAQDFADALDDNFKLTQCMFKLDKLDKTAFSVFLTLSREKLSALFRDDPSRKSVTEAFDLLCDAAEMLELNVSATHISGMLCAALLK